jgi:hypothetical protein
MPYYLKNLNIFNPFSKNMQSELIKSDPKKKPFDVSNGFVNYNLKEKLFHFRNSHGINHSFILNWHCCKVN